MPQLAFESYFGQFFWALIFFGGCFFVASQFFIKDFIKNLNLVDQKFELLKAEFSKRKSEIANVDEKISSLNKEIREYQLSLIRNFYVNSNRQKELKMIEIRKNNIIYKDNCINDFDLILSSKVSELLDSYSYLATFTSENLGLINL
jgi:hypothetical protein